MSKIIIGTAGHRNVGFDIPELLVSRLLVQANSGGGKSFLLRRMLEQGYGKVQSIVIDPAGEFATLREKFGFVLVGEHGETPADVRSAGLVAEKLLELHASAVCDLYSLKPHERHTWVKLFLQAVMNAPKRLWHPVLFVVDEAHKFCPEKGEGESEAKEMMLSLASDGRKYGFCAVFATQRLAKLDKSAASELTNVLIGPTFMDIDLQRAHKALGIVPREQAAFNAEMKTLAPGHFWALGRAISKTRILLRVGGIQTTHPTAGGKQSAEPPPAPEKIKALLPKLADLPQEAETKARTEAEFKREIRELKSKLSAISRQPSAKPVAPAAPAKVDPRAIERAVKVATMPLLKQLSLLQGKAKRVGDAIQHLRGVANGLQAGIDEIANAPTPEIPKPVPAPAYEPLAPAIKRELDGQRALAESRSPAPIDGDSRSLGLGERKILIGVAQFGKVHREQLTVLTGYKRSSRDIYLQRLAQRGYVRSDKNGVQILDAGIEVLGSDYEPLPTGVELQEYWQRRLTGGELKIFQFLLGRDGVVDRDLVSDSTGYKRSSRDIYLQRLASRCIVESVGGGQVRLTDGILGEDGARARQA